MGYDCIRWDIDKTIRLRLIYNIPDEKRIDIDRRRRKTQKKTPALKVRARGIARTGRRTSGFPPPGAERETGRREKSGRGHEGENRIHGEGTEGMPEEGKKALRGHSKRAHKRAHRHAKRAHNDRQHKKTQNSAKR